MNSIILLFILVLWITGIVYLWRAIYKINKRII